MVRPRPDPSHASLVKLLVSIIRQHSPRAADNVLSIQYDHDPRAAHLAAVALVSIKHRLDSGEPPVVDDSALRENYASALPLYEEAVTFYIEDYQGGA